MVEVIRMMIVAHEETERDWIDVKTLPLFYEMANNQTIAPAELMKAVLNNPEIEKSGDKVRLTDWKKHRKKLRQGKFDTKKTEMKKAPAQYENLDWVTFTSNANAPKEEDLDLMRVSLTPSGYVYLRVFPKYAKDGQQYLIQARKGAIRLVKTDKHGFMPQRYRNGNKRFFRLAKGTANRFIDVIQMGNCTEIYFRHVGDLIFEEVNDD